MYYHGRRLDYNQGKEGCGKSGYKRNKSYIKIKERKNDNSDSFSFHFYFRSSDDPEVLSYVNHSTTGFKVSGFLLFFSKFFSIFYSINNCKVSFCRWVVVPVPTLGLSIPSLRSVFFFFFLTDTRGSS